MAAGRRTATALAALVVTAAISGGTPQRQPGRTIDNAIVGVGDLTGDGRNDYVACDSAGLLWRYDGDGKGRFSARTRIGTGWNIFSTLL